MWHFQNKIFMLACIEMLIQGCGTKPDEGGKCALQCGDAIIGANDPSFKIETWAQNTKISCSRELAGQKLQKYPTSLKFLAYRDLGPAGGGAKQPVPSMAFSANSSGSMLEAVTPKGDWCSDACGVMTVDFVPTCPQSGSVFDVSVFVNSGALKSDIVTISIETEKPIEATTLALDTESKQKKDSDFSKNSKVVGFEQPEDGVKIWYFRKKAGSVWDRDDDRYDRVK